MQRREERGEINIYFSDQFTSSAEADYVGPLWCCDNLMTPPAQLDNVDTNSPVNILYIALL